MTPRYDDSWTRAAMTYAQVYGWYVVPTHVATRGVCSCGNRRCADPGRHPRIAVAEATCDREVLLQWSGRWTEAGIAVATGARSGIVALSLDASQKHKWSKLLDRYGQLPAAPNWYDTATGRLTLLFGSPDVALPPETIVAEGAVLHGDGGLVDAPSYVLGSDRSYVRWRETPDLTPPPTLPAWLLNRCTPVRHLQPGNGSADATEGREGVFTSARALYTHGPQVDWVVEGWAAGGSLSIVAGPAKAGGKSTWLMRLAGACCAGGDFLGHAARRGRAILLTEQSPAGFKRLIEDSHFPPPGLDRLEIVYLRDVAGTSWQGLITLIAARAETIDAQFVVFDSLNRFAGLGVAPDDTRPAVVLDGLQELLDQGLAVAGSCVAPPGTHTLDVIHSLGLVASAADVVTVIQPHDPSRRNVRKVEVLSRYRETPAHLLVELHKDGSYRRVDQRLGEPLFHQLDAYEQAASGMATNQPRAEA